MKPGEGFKQLTDITESHLELRQCLAIAKGVLKCLHILHVRGISQKHLQLDDIFVKIGSTVSKDLNQTHITFIICAILYMYQNG